MADLTQTRWLPIVMLVASKEIITLVMFLGFAFWYLGEKPRWNHLAALLCIFGAVAFTFLPKK